MRTKAALSLTDCVAHVVALAKAADPLALADLALEKLGLFFAELEILIVVLEL